MTTRATRYDSPEALLAPGGMPELERILFSATSPTCGQRNEAAHLEWLITKRIAFSVSVIEIPFVDTRSLMARRGNESWKHLAWKESAVSWLVENGHQDIEIEGQAVYGEAELTMLRTLPSDSVQCCVTSPPYYGLRDYGVDGQIGLEKTPEEFIARLAPVIWREEV